MAISSLGGSNGTIRSDNVTGGTFAPGVVCADVGADLRSCLIKQPLMRCDVLVILCGQMYHIIFGVFGIRENISNLSVFPL